MTQLSRLFKSYSVRRLLHSLYKIWFVPLAGLHVAWHPPAVPRTATLFSVEEQAQQLDGNGRDQQVQGPMPTDLLYAAAQ